MEKLRLIKTEHILFLIFAALGAANILSHDLWRDEFQAFLIARESLSVPDLFERASYEGHPPLWFLALFAITRLTPDPFYMQLFHYLLACAAVFVLLRLPVAGWQKYLMSFGYFAVYEYLAISRNYASGFLLCALLLKLLLERPRSYPLISIALFALSFTSVYGMMLAVFTAFYLLMEAVSAGPSSWARPGPAEAAALGSVVAAGLALSAALVIPPPDCAVETAGWFSSFDFTRLARVVTSIWKSYVPIPEISPHFWDTHLLESRPLRVLVSLGILGASLALFFPKRNIFLLYGFGTFSLLAFSYLKFPGYLRHHGHLYILFMMCLVLANQAGSNLPGGPRLLRRAARGFVASILILQAIAGATASVLSWGEPFSAAKSVAGYIKAQGMEDYFIMGDRDFALTTISGHLGKPLFHAASGKFATYVTWNSERLRRFEPREIVEYADRMRSETGRKVLLILNYPLPEGEEGNLVKLREFTQSVKKDEKYFLYMPAE